MPFPRYAVDALARGVRENGVKPGGVRSLTDQRLKSKDAVRQIERRRSEEEDAVGSCRMATRLSAGNASFRSSSRLLSKCVFAIDKPVRFLPGWARLSTIP